MILKFLIFLFITEEISGKLITVSDKNELKKELKSHTNIIILFYENERTSFNAIKLFEDVSEPASKIAKLIIVDCKDNKKLCKQYKVDSNTAVIQHFHKGKFNKVYDRKLRSDSLLRFLEDPTGDIPWEEEDTAKDIVHARSSQDLQKLVQTYKNNIPPLIMMFYAPWCGHCKKMKPEFASVASGLKSRAVFIGINGDLSTTDDLKQAFNVSGYPSIFYVQEGNKVYRFEGANTKEDLIKFVDNPIRPEPPKEKPWSEETDEISFLTDSDFDDFISQHNSVLVMFFAPWCGHCKALKPEIIEAVKQLKQSQVDGRIAAVDATENKNISTFFNVTGYPMLKYFKDGQYQYDTFERTKDGLVKFMTSPQKPKEPEKEIPWHLEESAVHHPSAQEFKSTLKRYKHSLVMFYAPWCGHCKKSKPGFTAAANEMKDNGKVAFVAVDCTTIDNSPICKSENVEGFPTLRYYNYGKTTTYSAYSLEREHDDFVAFMTDPLKPKLDARRHWKHIAGHEAIAVLTTGSFAQSIVSQTSGALVMFYAPWCGHCNTMKPSFVAAATALKYSLPTCILGTVDATTETNLAAQYKVDGFPTLIYFSPSGDWSVYNGGRKENDIIDFMLKKDQALKAEEEQRQLNELKIRSEEIERKQKEENDRRVKEENERKEKEEIERKRNEEKELKQKEKEEELKKKKIEEKKQRDELERKQKEQIAEKERKDKEENERKQREELKQREQEEQRKKEDEENKRKEDMERKQKEELAEKERKYKEEKQRKENEELKRKEEEELKKKKIEEKKQRDELERKQKEQIAENERKDKEEKERKQREEEKQRKKEAEEHKQKEEIEKKQKEELAKNERKDKQENDELKRKEEEELQTINEEKVKGKVEDVEYLSKVESAEIFQSRISSDRLTLVYLHQSGKKSHIRQKVVKLLAKYGERGVMVSGAEVDCSVVVSVCDSLALDKYPSLVTFKNGRKMDTLTDSWSEDDLQRIISSSLRDEL